MLMLGIPENCTLAKLHCTCPGTWRTEFHQLLRGMCRHAPFLIAFEERAQVFQTVIAADRAKHREMGAYGPQSFVTIHRDTLMQVCNSPRAFSDPRNAVCPNTVALFQGGAVPISLSGQPLI